MTINTVKNKLSTLKINYIPTKVPTLDKSTFGLLVSEGKKVEFTVECIVNKDVASLILEKHNPKNRKIRANSVAAIARDMENSRWLGHVGDEITIDNFGHLNNGQHRLSAIADTGISQRVAFRFGINEDSRLVEGRGLSKQFSDYIAMSGDQYKHQNALASTTRLLYGFILDQKRPQSASGNNKPTNGELNDVMEDHGVGLYESLIYMKSIGMLKIMVDTNAAMLHYLFKNSTYGKDKADEFFSAIATGAGLSADDPRLIVRNRFTATTTGKMFRQQFNKDSAMALVVKAWNAWTDDKKWSSKERTPANIPTIAGLDKLGDHDLYKKNTVTDDND